MCLSVRRLPSWISLSSSRPSPARIMQPYWKPWVHSVQPRVVYWPSTVNTGVPRAGSQVRSINRAFFAARVNTRWVWSNRSGGFERWVDLHRGYRGGKEVRRLGAFAGQTRHFNLPETASGAFSFPVSRWPDMINPWSPLPPPPAADLPARPPRMQTRTPGGVRCARWCLTTPRGSPMRCHIASPAGSRSSRHHHADLLQLDVIHQCRGEATLDDKITPLSETTLLVASPGQAHGYTLSPVGEHAAVWLIKR